MGVYWGSQWFQVEHKEAEKCGIILINKYPSASGEVNNLGNEVCHATPPEVEGYKFIGCEDRAEAEYRTKMAIMKITEEVVFDLSCCLLNAEREIEYAKINMKYKTDRPKAEYQRILDQQKEYAAHDKERIKAVKALRRKPIKELVESEL